MAERMLIDGELVSGDSEQKCVNPSDGSPLGPAPEASERQVSQAVESSCRAFQPWRDTPLEERQQLVLTLANEVRRRVEALALLEAQCAGLPVNVATRDIERGTAEIEYLAGIAPEVKGVTVPSASGRIHATLREAYGPTVRIVAFNHPIGFTLRKLAAPLLTGNTVLVKVPEQAPLGPLRLASIVHELFPPGVINVLSGPGATTGNALVGATGVRRVAFIGSVRTGRAILARCAERGTPASLELGGKNPLIVCEGADLNAAVEAAFNGMNYKTAGQSCSSLSRVLVYRKLHDEFRERLTRRMNGLVIGHALDAGTEMGPVINSAAAAHVEACVDDARRRGATITRCSTLPTTDTTKGGFYCLPTLVSDVDSNDPIAQEEVFGPIQVLLPWDDLDEAIEIANNSVYGLVASVHTRDISQALAAVSRLDAGSVAVNGGGETHWRGLPFGGYKASGMGKEEDLTELLECTRVKSVAIAPAAGSEPTREASVR